MIELQHKVEVSQNLVIACRINAQRNQDDLRRVSREHRDVVTSRLKLDKSVAIDFKISSSSILDSLIN